MSIGICLVGMLARMPIADISGRVQSSDHSNINQWLNSRNLFLTRGIEIFDNTNLGAHIITRAKRIATVERWNVPQKHHQLS
ncbi:hypothetical protein C8Q80DRAFT_1176147 [Daedaleopsis nitida]|nr:hypothetical protein C8Q80DRAFT_1176147 [Daedaleopsis nitida]